MNNDFRKGDKVRVLSTNKEGVVDFLSANNDLIGVKFNGDKTCGIIYESSELINLSDRVRNEKGRKIKVGDKIEFNGMMLDVKEVRPNGKILVDNGVDSWWVNTSEEGMQQRTAAPACTTFENVCNSMIQTYKRKNHDYGNSFDISLDKYSEISALTRISDKFNRIENLFLKGGQQVNDESIDDTILDMANYCVMWYTYRQNKQNAEKNC